MVSGTSEEIMEIFAVVMAGGRGRRFWPFSREKTPKQFLPLQGEKTMLESTIDRIRPIITEDRIYTIVSKGQAKLARKILSDALARNIIEEPIGKDTALCVGLGAVLCKNKNPDGIMIVLPADHLILDEEQFRETLILGTRIAEDTGALVTLGIPPTRPETGYGYIQYETAGLPPYQSTVHKVKTFAEKPTPETAERFLRSGDFVWNSGVFIWRIPAILREFEQSLPETYEGLREIERNIGRKNFRKTMKNIYSQLKSISVDYGIMEKANNVIVIKGDFGWSDMGSWEEIYRMGDRDEFDNVVKGNAITHNSSGNLIYGDKRLIASIGLNDCVIVDTKDVLLICRRDHTQELKEVVDKLKKSSPKHL